MPLLYLLHWLEAPFACLAPRMWSVYGHGLYFGQCLLDFVQSR